MNTSPKYRFHMGCGEPLQSRRCVTHARRAPLPGDHEGREERLNKRNPAARPGAKCKL